MLALLVLFAIVLCCSDRLEELKQSLQNKISCIQAKMMIVFLQGPLGTANVQGRVQPLHMTPASGPASKRVKMATHDGDKI